LRQDHDACLIARFIAPDAGNLGEGPATVIGSSQRVAPRFAAFANAVGIHADDYDDTQLAVAKDPGLRTPDVPDGAGPASGPHGGRGDRRGWRGRHARLQAMIAKVDFVVDEEAAGYDKMAAIIDISLEDGRKVSGRAGFGKGSPANPTSYEEVSDKFRETAGCTRLGRDRIEDVVAMVRDLETLGSIDRPLTPLRF